MNNTQQENAAVPRDASTVILLREKAKPPFELFLMRRHRNQSFMGGAFVFPGGALDAADCDPALSACSGDISNWDAGRHLNEPDTGRETAMGLFFAAIRETFEEAGVLLADAVIDGPGKTDGIETIGDISPFRQKIHDGELTLKALAEEIPIRYALDRLMPYSRWITPEVEKKRFDTRFFIARMPAHQRPEHDAVELVESLWATPKEALEKHEQNKIMLMPPTLKTIEELSGYASVEEVFGAVAGKIILPILPQAYVTDSGFAIKLPHDPEYTIDAYKQPFREDDPSRVVMIDGRFHTMFFGQTE